MARKTKQTKKPSKKKTTSRNSAAKKHSKKIRGLKTSWIEAGTHNKIIFVMIHGFPDDAAVWDKQIQHFSKKFHVIAPHLRGTKASKGTLGQSRFNTRSILLDLLSIIRNADPEGKKKIIVMGHDIGSAYAWKLADLLKDRCLGLIIINGSHINQFFKRLIENRYQLAKSWYVGFFITPIIPEVLLKSIPNFVKKSFLKSLGFPEAHLNRHEDAFKNSHEIVKHYRSLLIDVLSSLVDHQISLPLDCPVLSLSGNEDQFLEPASIKELEPFTETPVVRVIEGSHWIQLEDHERVNRLIEKFLKQDCKIKS